MAAGTHTISLELVDALDQPLPIPAAHQITVDALPPVITITSPENGATLPSGSVVVQYTISAGPNSYSHVHVMLDGSTTMVFNPTSTYALNGLAFGNHTIGFGLASATHQLLVEHQINITIGDALPPPVAAYRFDEATGNVAGDISGNGLDGTVEGATWTPEGRFGSALVFDGNARVSIADAAPLDLGTGMTLSAWVYPTQALGSWAAILQKGADAYLLHASSPSKLPAGGGTVGGTCCPLAAGGVAPVGSWTHLAVTYDGAQMVLYRDGVAVATQQAGGSLLATASPLEIGNNSYNEGFIGRIDEVRVYDFPLSAAEIRSVPEPAQTLILLPGILFLGLAYCLRRRREALHSFPDAKW